jgi:hypothetical protein
MIGPVFLLALALGACVPAARASNGETEIASAAQPLAFDRVAQSVNLNLSDHVGASPTPQMLQTDPDAAWAALRQWVADGRILVAAQRRQLQTAYVEAQLSPSGRSAAHDQQQTLLRFMDGLDILFDAFDAYSASSATLLRNQPWFVDAYYDSRLLAIRIGQDLILAKARTEQDPIIASSLRVFARSADIQLELARAGHNRAHASYLDAQEMADNFSRAAAGMAEALAAAQAAIALAGDDPRGWGDSLHYEALILQETVKVAEQMRARSGLSHAGRASILDGLVELYRHRPSRDMVFASSLTL